ncbi:MAG: hypothetical protein AAFY71_20750 [Bacteroidota bacterium]
MERIISLALFCCLVISSIHGQNKWSVQLDTGVGAGWWVYDKGLTDTLPNIHRGYDRTHLAFIFPVSMGLRYQHKNLTLGMQLGIASLRDDRMVASDHRRGDFNKYSISTDELEGVPLAQVAAQLGYVMVSGKRLELTPIVYGGFNWTWHDHPEVAEFNQRIYRAVDLQFRIKLASHLSLLLFPRYTNILLRESDTPYESSKHNVYAIGLHTGLQVDW